MPEDTAALIAERKAELDKLTQKQQRLADAFLDGVMERDIYAAEKEKILSREKILTEQRDSLSRGKFAGSNRSQSG